MNILSEKSKKSIEDDLEKNKDWLTGNIPNDILITHKACLYDLVLIVFNHLYGKLKEK